MYKKKGREGPREIQSNAIDLICDTLRKVFFFNFIRQAEAF